MIRHDWTVEEALALFELPFMELCHQAQTMHRAHHPADKVQLCTKQHQERWVPRGPRTALSRRAMRPGSTPRRCCRSRRSSSRRVALKRAAPALLHGRSLAQGT